MAKYEEVIIRIEKEKLERLKELGFSVKEVFYRGFQELLRQKYDKYLTSDDDIDEFGEDDDFSDFIETDNSFRGIMFPGGNIDNN
jgi:hypothetical protein